MQKFLTQKAANYLSKKLNTKVQVQGLQFTLTNKLQLKGLYLEDLHHDTLLYAGKMQVNITDWFFLKDSADLKYISLSDAVVHLSRSTDSTWNSQFLSDFFGGKKDGISTTAGIKDTAKKSTSYHLKNIELENFTLIQQDGWKGKTTKLYLGKMNLNANKIDFAKKLFDIDELNLINPSYSEMGYKGLWSFDDSVAYRQRMALKLRNGDFPENPNDIQLHIAKFNFENGNLGLKSGYARATQERLFNDGNISLANLSGHAENVSWKQDTLSAKLDLVANERSGLKIKKLNADFTFHPQMMEFKNLDAQLNESHITDYAALKYEKLKDLDDLENKVYLDCNFKNSNIATNDIAFFAPDLLSKKQNFNINGDIKGYVNNLSSNDFKLVQNGSIITGKLHMIGLPNIETTTIDFTTQGSNFKLADMAVWAPSLNNLDKGVKQALADASFKGSFKGLVNNFAVNGELKTNVGLVYTDLKLNLANGKNEYDGFVKLQNFEAGKITGSTDIGIVNFEGKIKGKGFDSKTVHLNYDGTLQDAFYNKYTYKNIHSSGALDGSILHSNLDLNDENLKGKVVVEVDLLKKENRYVGKGYLSKANFKSLHLTNKEIQFDGNFDVDFTGKNIDDFLGHAKLYNAHLLEGKIPFLFDSLIVNSSINKNGNKELDLQTNELDASVQGKFNIADLPNSFQYFLNDYYPTLIPAPKKKIKDQDFGFAINTRNIAGYLQLFDKKIEGLSNSSIVGNINTNNEQIVLNANVPFFKYDKVQLTNAYIQGNGNQHNLNLVGSWDNFFASDSLAFPNGKLNISTANGNSKLRLKTSSGGLLGDAEIVADVIEKPEGIQMDFDTSNFILNNKKWGIAKGGTIFLTKNKVLNIDKLTLKQDEQELVISTELDADGSDNNVVVNMKKLNLGDLMPMLTKDPTLEGLASGKIIINDPLGKPKINVDTKFEAFRLNSDSFGVVTAKGNIDVAKGIVDVNLISNNESHNFTADVLLNLKDSTGNQLNAVVKLKHERLDFLNHYLSTIFDNVDGYASGDLMIKGKANSPQLIGDISLTGAKIKVGYTQVTYYFDSGSILKLTPAGIEFPDMGIKDKFGHSGILSGGISEHFFKDMSYNIAVNSNRMELLNTTSKNNSLFYGNAVGSGSFNLTGPQNNLKIKITAEPTDTSHISISNSNTRESSNSDDIIFKTYGREMTAASKNQNDHLLIDVDLKANNLATIDVILDPITGDIISAKGNGKLNVQMDDGVITMDGKYIIESGSYSYNFQSFIHKPFDLQGDGTNYIEWKNKADPLNANLNIKATYKAINVNLNDLSGDNGALLNKNVTTTKSDVNVVAILTGPMGKPNIGFEIDFPTGSAARNDETVNNLMNLIKGNQSELLRQVTYLVVFNQFAAYGEGRSNRNPGADFVLNTISDIVSRELGKIFSNILFQIFKDRSIQVDFSTSVYNSSNFYSGTLNTNALADRSTTNLNVHFPLFNNKIIINAGNGFDFGFNNAATSSFQYLPNFSIEFILTTDRRLRFIVFKKDNLDLGGRRNRLGISLSYRKDTDPWFNKMNATNFPTIEHKN